MRKTFKKIAALIAAGAVMASAAAMPAMAAADRGYSPAEIEASEVKPVITISRIMLQKDGAAGTTVDVTIDISGAEGKYASTGVFLWYDERLTLERSGTKTGSALSDCLSRVNAAYGFFRKTGMNHRFFASASSADNGHDGTLWELKFTLPDDAQPGDVYPFDLVYMNESGVETLISPIVNSDLITAYTFTKGIYCLENPTFEASTADKAKCPALADIDKTYDGYIAIESNSAKPAASLGDIDGNGSVDSSDASLALAEYASVSTGNGSIFTEIQRKAADVDGNGTINSDDASKILGYYSFVSTGNKGIDMEHWMNVYVPFK